MHHPHKGITFIRDERPQADSKRIAKAKKKSIYVLVSLHEIPELSAVTGAAISVRL